MTDQQPDDIPTTATVAESKSPPSRAEERTARSSGERSSAPTTSQEPISSDEQHLAVEALKKLRPEELEALRKSWRVKEKRKRGRKVVPPEEFQPHMAFMADRLCEAERTGTKPNERKASRETEEWARSQQGLNFYSAETIRGRFRQDSATYLAAARKRHRSGDAESRREPGREPTASPRSRSSAGSYRGSGDSRRTVTLADLGFTATARQFGLEDETIALLTRPGAFDVAWNLVAAEREAVAPSVATSAVLRELEAQNAVLDEVRTQRTITDIVDAYRVPENLTTKPVGEDIIRRQLAWTNPAEEINRTVKGLMEASEPIEVGVAGAFPDDPHKMMRDLFSSFKLNKDPFG